MRNNASAAAAALLTMHKPAQPGPTSGQILQPPVLRPTYFAAAVRAPCLLTGGFKPGKRL